MVQEELSVLKQLLIISSEKIVTHKKANEVSILSALSFDSKNKFIPCYVKSQLIIVNRTGIILMITVSVFIYTSTPFQYRAKGTFN